MNRLITQSSSPISNVSINSVTINTDELLTIINIARKDSGETIIRNNDFISRVKDELDGEHYEIFVVQNSNRTESEVIRLSNDQAMLVSMRESKAVRRIVLDKLKHRQIPALPTNYVTALEALLEAEKLKAEKEFIIEQQAPKVAFVDHYVAAGGSKSLRETAKILRMPEKAMIEALLRDKALFRQSGNLLPNSVRQREGLFTVKTGSAETGHNYTQTRVTAKGIQWIAERYASELMGDL